MVMVVSLLSTEHKNLLVIASLNLENIPDRLKVFQGSYIKGLFL